MTPISTKYSHLALGILQREIMAILWNSSRALSTQDILRIVNRERTRNEKLSVSTIITTLGRLRNTGYVTRTKHRGVYYHTPGFSVVELERLISNEINCLIEEYSPRG